MATLRELNIRLKTLQSTLKTINAMKMISSTRFQKLQRTANTTIDFADDVAYLAQFTTIDWEGDQDVLIVYSGDRGLCGGYNSQIIKYLRRNLKDEHVLFIGTRAAKIVPQHVVAIESNPSHDFLSFCYQLTDALQIEQRASIRLLYTHYQSASKQEIRDESILPFTARPDYCLHEHAPESNIIWLRDYIACKMYQALIHAQLSEYSTRMLAMNAASNNAHDMIDELQLTYNKLRQSMITSAISETTGVGDE